MNVMSSTDDKSASRDSSKIPFPLLCNESIEYNGRLKNGEIFLTNFRLFIKEENSFINIPVGILESVKCREIYFLNIFCKDGKVIRCEFSNSKSCQDWLEKIVEQISRPKEKNSVFAIGFFDKCKSNKSPENQCYELCRQEKHLAYSLDMETDRMEFDLNNASCAWRKTCINDNFSVCPSYPKYNIVPACIKDEELEEVAGYRDRGRFPSVVWRNQGNGAVLVRSSQPMIGLFGWTNNKDEKMLKAIAEACSREKGNKTEKTMVIVDCRSYFSAYANCARGITGMKGGGYERERYYSYAQIEFMGLPNIHEIRKSFVSFRDLCSESDDQPYWLSRLEKTYWFTYLSALLKTALFVVNAIHKDAKPVLVHCTDGWDRTTQIIALAELLLDPYYRTLEGFAILIQREWLDFGHKFGDRCGNGVKTDDPNQRCPVFLQWLDCVYQLYRQFPCEFEFNEAYLIKLVQHTYSNLFGTILYNNTSERSSVALVLGNNTASVWSLLSDEDKFKNHLYQPSSINHVLHPSYSIRTLQLWKSLYLSKPSIIEVLETKEQKDTEISSGISNRLDLDGLTRFTDPVQESIRMLLRKTGTRTG